MTSYPPITHEQIDWFHDPYPDYARLRQSGVPLWLPHDENYASEGVWLFSRYHAAESILKRTSGVTKNVRSKRFEADQTPFDIHMLNRDGADHARLRNLVAHFFSSKSIRNLEPEIRLQAERLLQSMSGTDEVDFISAFAEPLPMAVIAGLIGVPQEDMSRIRKWSLMISRGSDSQLVDDDLKNGRKEALSEFIDYTEWLVAEKAASPVEDLISHLVHCESEDLISREETVGMIAFLLFAGHETTVGLIGNMVWLLLMHPEQWLLLREKPELAMRAVEETLRYESPTQRSTYRFATERINISGFELEAGQQFAVILGSANRDGAFFSDPDRFDIQRAPNRHLAFGIGVHNCIGKTLARVEARVALEQLINLREQPVLITDRPSWNRNSFFRGLEKLPVKLG
ncbi:cytochrome P450 [Solemya elarraichensis gill symbiont]|uniref:Cytochrome n=1 Tax=Solemya elarraichensis gill symbiont TaxID=1918949 RepID=A0A1T2KZG4_9GAMM|nr:cytochrome P450 [Solemya elarraichensis gill symbiont]OOZ38233.1 hypothetical protein BOW52_09005 [Solemya elarraichensis gill symbiont]